MDVKGTRYSVQRRNLRRNFQSVGLGRGWNWNGTGEAWMVVDVVIHRYSSNSRGVGEWRISSNWMAALGFASRESTWADAEEALLNLNPCLPSILPTRKFHRIEIAHFAWISEGINSRIRRTNIKFLQKGLRSSLGSSYQIMGDARKDQQTFQLNGKIKGSGICANRQKLRNEKGMFSNYRCMSEGQTVEITFN